MNPLSRSTTDSVVSRVVAIDGPSGSGKSTVARRVAHELGLVYIDTGAMFRALGLLADRQQRAFEEGPSLESFLVSLRMEYGRSPDELIVLNGENVSTAIREHRVSDLASRISKLPSVRRYLLQFQRDLASNRLCAMEGRDIGTVVFPHAFCKIFLTASDEVRAQRRVDELRARGETSIDVGRILADIRERDQRDSSRDIAPLVAAADAIRVDTSTLTIDDVVARITEIAKERAQRQGLAL